MKAGGTQQGQGLCELKHLCGLSFTVNPAMPQKMPRTNRFSANRLLVTCMAAGNPTTRYHPIVAQATLYRHGYDTHDYSGCKVIWISLV